MKENNAIQSENNEMCLLCLAEQKLKCMCQKTDKHQINLTTLPPVMHNIKNEMQF